MSGAINIGRMRPIAGRYKFRNSAFLRQIEDTRDVTGLASLWDAEHFTANGSLFGGRDTATTDDIFSDNSSGTLPSRTAEDAHFADLPSLDLAAVTDFSFRSRGIYLPYAASPGAAISFLVSVYIPAALLAAMTSGAQKILISATPTANQLALKILNSTVSPTGNRIQFRIQNSIGTTQMLNIAATAGAHIFGVTYDPVSTIARIYDNSLSAVGSHVQAFGGIGLATTGANIDPIYWFGDHSGLFPFTGQASVGAVFNANMADADLVDIWTGLIQNLGDEQNITISA